jgi:nucleotide-binding universal stress UspA family protein
VSAFSKVMVAVDGSPNAAHALDVAAQVAIASSADLIVVHAVGLLEEQSVHDISVEDRVDEIENQVDEWCQPLRDANVEHTVEVVPGSPVPALLLAASRAGADLLVVGSRGVGGHGGRQLGSTSQGLVQESEVPVLVVPSPA